MRQPIETVEDFVAAPEDVQQKMDSLFQRAVDKMNSVSVSRASHVQRWLLLPRDFFVGEANWARPSSCGGALCSRFYQRETDALYATLESAAPQ